MISNCYGCFLRTKISKYKTWNFQQQLSRHPFSPCSELALFSSITINYFVPSNNYIVQQLNVDCSKKISNYGTGRASFKCLKLSKKMSAFVRCASGQTRRRPTRLIGCPLNNWNTQSAPQLVMEFVPVLPERGRQGRLRLVRWSCASNEENEILDRVDANERTWDYNGQTARTCTASPTSIAAVAEQCQCCTLAVVWTSMW